MNSLFILAPFFAVLILNLPFKSIMRIIALWVGIVLSLMQVWLVVFRPDFFWKADPQLLNALFRFKLSTDNLTLLLLLCIGIISAIIFFLARFTVESESKRFNLASLLLIMLAGLNGTVMVTDIFSLYVFLEITAVASFILIALDKDKFALEAAFKYIMLSGVATVLMLASIAIILLLTGQTEFSGISDALKNSSHSWLIILSVGIFICGLFIKSGIVPFHGWLPDVYMAAPAVVSALLASIVTKTAGVYSLMRMVTSVFAVNVSINNLLLAVGIISIILGALAALRQSDFKRMLAYSSISQVGYIIIGLGCGTPLGIAGAFFHFFNHTIFKSLLFINSAAVETQTGLRDMDKMSGLASRMPVTGTTSLIASLSAAGIPPLAGFWSKLIIIIALWMSGRHFYAALALGAGIITLAYFLSMQRRVFFGNIKDELKNIKEANAGLVFCEIVLAVIVVGAGLAVPFILGTFLLPITSIFGVGQ